MEDMQDIAHQLRRTTTLYLCFLLYSIIGWLYEVFLEVVIYQWGFSNRGVLFGPWCPIYGLGALLLIITLDEIRHKPAMLGKINFRPLLILLYIAALTTLLELAGSYTMEFLTGSWLWDYTGRFLNFQGRVCFDASLRFTIGGMLILYLLQPLFEHSLARIDDQPLLTLGLVLDAFFGLDCLITVYKFFFI